MHKKTLDCSHYSIIQKTVFCLEKGKRLNLAKIVRSEERRNEWFKLEYSQNCSSHIQNSAPISRDDQPDSRTTTATVEAFKEANSTVAQPSVLVHINI